jgi:mannose-6-phosphate isomerase-like protein (cupin superfamily)
MRVTAFPAAAALIIGIASSAFCQNLDGRPYNPQTDPNVDMFMGSWRESMPRHSHGSMIERDILTRGDSLNPPRKSAVLEYVKRFSYGMLPVRAVTAPTTLKGEQEVFYVDAGEGRIQWKNKTADLYAGVCFLVPEGLEFTIENTGGDVLAMYIVAEPTYEGFKPVGDVVVRDSQRVDYNSVIGHWSYKEKDLILGHHGLAVLHAVITLTLGPMTIGHPHFHVKGTEEVWTTISGDNIAWLGKQLRDQPPGTAYMIPPDGRTNHSNINEMHNGEVVMLYFAVRQDLKK